MRAILNFSSFLYVHVVRCLSLFPHRSALLVEVRTHSLNLRPANNNRCSLLIVDLSKPYCCHPNPTIGPSLSCVLFSFATLDFGRLFRQVLSTAEYGPSYYPIIQEIGMPLLHYYNLPVSTSVSFLNLWWSFNFSFPTDSRRWFGSLFPKNNSLIPVHIGNEICPAHVMQIGWEVLLLHYRKGLRHTTRNNDSSIIDNRHSASRSLPSYRPNQEIWCDSWSITALSNAFHSSWFSSKQYMAYMLLLLPH